MTNIRPNLEEFVAFIDELAQSSWLGDARAHWPRYLFHFTDVRNAVSILKNEMLFSRSAAVSRGLMVSDNASSEIIARTPTDRQRYVRLYFRPRVPTFYRNEGIRPRHHREGAHCPIPIAFLFDSISVLKLNNSEFTEGSWARTVCQRGSDIDFLRSLPFRKIYHDVAMPDGQEEKDEIIFRRQAEVLVPDSLGIVDTLKRIYVRSTAERDTLQFLLEQQGVSEEVLQRWPIIVNRGRQLFHKRWTFVERVAIGDDRIRVDFNPPLNPNKNWVFNAEIWLEDPDDNSNTLHATKDDLDLSKPVEPTKIRIPASLRDSGFNFRLELDGCLAYSSRMSQEPSATLLGPA